MSSMPAHAQERLDAVLNAAPKRRAPTEHHLLLKARTLVDTDKGDFEAIISSESVVRRAGFRGDRVWWFPLFIQRVRLGSFGRA